MKEMPQTGIKIGDSDFYCPKCKQKASTANPMFVRYSFHRIELTIFLCSPCRTSYIDKPTLRRQISEWRRYSWGAKNQPFEKLYREFLGELEKMVDQLGYKPIRFKKSYTT